MQQSDGQLLVGIKRDDSQSFELLFRRYFPRLKAISYSFVKDDSIAKDIVQEVFIKVWEKRSEIKDIAIESFLFKMVRNQCLNYLRHVKVVDNRVGGLKDATQMEELYRIDIIKDEPYLLIEKELEQEIVSVLNELPEKCREVFKLSRIDGLMNSEIAEKLDVSIKNVEKHMTKALKHFREHFKDRLPVQIIILVLLNYFDKL
ncbi:RNA polymerase sigma-70 factor [Labilibacter sediminis]|nr:RNA polymerase sigma-70 factor [Labilibacter sediminis]